MPVPDFCTKMTQGLLDPLESLDTSEKILLRKPTTLDGASVHHLVATCKPLDVNSLYCNILQCHHFSDTAILAELNGKTVGFISGYRLPEQPDTLFVWQVAVAPDVRGSGLATRMLSSLIKRQQDDIRFLHTSITESNAASWNTFRRVAEQFDAPFNSDVLFERDQHLDGKHDTEFLVQIGPFNF